MLRLPAANRLPGRCSDGRGIVERIHETGTPAVVQMQRQFRTNNETFVVDNQGADAIGFDALFAMFSTKISNFATAKMVLGPGKRWNPDQEQSRWLYFALGFLLENRMQLMEINIKDAARTLLDLVCTGRIRHRAVDIRNERNFGREVLRIIGYRRSYLVKRLNVPGNPQELREFFEREQQPLPLAFDEDLFRVELPRDLIELMKRHDPGKFQTVRLSQDPLEAAKAVNRFARNFFRPYIAAIENLPVTVSAPLSQRVYSLDTVQFDDDLRASLLINRAQELPVLAKAHFSSTRDRAVLEEIVRDLLTRPEMRELVDRHLRVTPRAGHTSKRIGLQSYFQRFDEHSERQAVASAQWQRIGSVSHELMHFYCHKDFEAKSGAVSFGHVITEGFTELMGLELLEALRRGVAQGERSLTDRLRGEAAAEEFIEAARGPAGRESYKTALQRAREVENRVGPQNVWAAYFLGKPELIGL